MLERASQSFSHTSRLGIEWPLRDPGWRSAFFFFFKLVSARRTVLPRHFFLSPRFSLFSLVQPPSLLPIHYLNLSSFLGNFLPIPILKSNPPLITTHKYVYGPSFDPAWQFQRNVGFMRHRPWAGPDSPSRPLGGSSVIPLRIFASRELRKRNLKS